MANCEIIVIDDEEVIRVAAEQALELANYKVRSFPCADQALKAIGRNVRAWPGIIISDIKMPGKSGLELLDIILQQDSQLPVILISGHADIPTAVKSIQQGAYEFLEKPFSASSLCDIARRAVDKRALVLDNRSLREELSNQRRSRQLLGCSAAIENLNKAIEHVAQTDADVLITGETGTGKELVARCLHDNGPRRSGQFVAINCGAMPETLFESEIFGHVRGAFTNAFNTQVGKLEFANHGTFFLDEIEGMPLNLQIKLLRVLQERKTQKIGSNEEIDLDIRVVAATKEDLLDASSRGEFREDLYYRLNVVALTIPPLRERKEDIPILLQHFYDLACKRVHRDVEAFPAKWLQRAMVHDWPGNVRELRNYAERVAIANAAATDKNQHKPSGIDINLQEQLVGKSLVGLPGQNPGDSSAVAGVSMDDHAATQPLQHRLESVEKHLIEQELQRFGGNITKTYEALGVSRKTLYDKMKKHQISKESVIKKLADIASNPT